jgi:penicillin-binding protein-related factor A (putative recombinase)
MLEKQIESDILKWLNLQHDTFAFKINTVGIFDVKKGIFRKNLNPYVHLGTSDILGVCQGRMFAIEVKTPKRLKDVTDAQRRFLDQVRLKGGLGIVATSLDQVILFIGTVRNLSLQS